MDLSIVIPARNEAERIEATLVRLSRTLRTLGVSYEIVLGDSSSTDETVARAKALGIRELRCVRSERPGKGRILTQALASTTGAVAGFVDADLEIDPAYLVPMYQAMTQGAEAAIASKTLIAGLDAGRPWHRRLITGGYNRVIRGLFRTGIADHQAGLKLFDGAMIRDLLPRIHSTEWLWDTEVLVALRQQRAEIVEIPVELGDHGRSHVSLGSTWFSTARDLASIFVRSRNSGVTSSPKALTERA